MNSVRLVSENGVSNIQKKLWYVDNSSEINLDNFEAGDRIYSINDNKLFQIEYDTSSEQEYSGEIVSFEADEDDRISSLEVEINPVQDLHGYANPWPAGGEKNKLAFTIDNLKTVNTSGTWSGNTYSKNGVNYAVTVDDAGNATGITVSGTASSAATIDIGRNETILPAGTYYITQNTITNVLITVYKIVDGSAASLGGVSTFTLTEETSIFIRYSVSSGNTASGTIKPMICTTSTSETFASYSNECPISGYTGMTVKRTGKNLFDENSVTSGKYLNDNGEVLDSSLFCITDYMPVASSCCYSGANGFFGTAPRSCFYDKNKKFISSVRLVNTTAVLTVPNEAKFIRISLRLEDCDTFQFELSSATTAYKNYTGTTIPITFPTTIYGGSDEIIGGVLESTLSLAKIKDLTWVFESNYNRFRTGDLASVIKYPSANNIPLAGLISSAYRTGSATQTGSAAINGTIGVSTSGVLYILDTAFTDIATFVTVMGEEQIVYPLATPNKYTLSQTEPTTLYGTNNVWTDAGEINIKVIKNDMTAFELKPYI